ncbi:MAG: hypothetical protein OXH93_16980 [Caldilineaceae bacterium]|nr:hypothetical protein [Caldilineaceae bacterium]
MEANGYDLSSSHLIRHCRAWQIDNDVPTFKAFRLRRNEEYLSFNWLEKICVDAGIVVDHKRAIQELEKAPPLEIGAGQLWAVLSCEAISAAVQEAAMVSPEIFPVPSSENPSHVGVAGYPKRFNRDVAVELAKRVRRSDLYPITEKRRRFRASR